MYVCRGGRDWAGIGVHVPVRPPVISSVLLRQKRFLVPSRTRLGGGEAARIKSGDQLHENVVCVWGEIQLTGYVAEERFRFICRDYGMAYYTVAVAVAAITLSIIKCVANVS